MSLRTGEIYLDWRVRQCLRMLAQASKLNGAVGTTSDAIADKVLQEWVEAKYPQLWAWVQQRQDSEQQMVQELANGKATSGTGTSQQPHRRGKAAVNASVVTDSGTGTGLD